MKTSALLIAASAFFVLGCQPKATPVTGPTASPAVTAGTTPAPSSTPAQANTMPGEGETAPKVQLGDLSASLPEGVTLTADHTDKGKSAFAFSGDKSGIETQVNINPEALPVCTLVTWAKFKGDPAAEETEQVVSHDDGGYDRSMGLDGRAGRWGWSTFVGNQAVAGGFPVVPNQWTFLAVVYNQPQRTVTFYAGDQKMELTDVDMGTGLDTTNVGTNPSYGEHFIGDIEPVKLYDRALSDEEIAKLRGTPTAVSASPEATPSATP